MESDLRREIRYTRTREAILATIKIGGLVTLAMMAPNVAGQLGRVYNQRERQKTLSSAKVLIQKGLLSVENDKFRITAKGRRYLDSLPSQKSKPRSWDKKWRIVIFDIPETRKTLRDALRYTLKRIGFLKLQNSSWIYPHDCEELVILLKADYRVGSEVIYIIASKVENDLALRRAFAITK